MNSVILIGRLTKDPELRYIAESGKAVATFTLAVNRPFSKEDKADFFRVVVFGKSAENCANFITKGRLVGVQGRLQNNNYETQAGEKRYTTEIIADRVEFLESRNAQAQRSEQRNNSPSPNSGLPEGFQALDDDDDEIPF
ncbi:MAG: single-stranded DNA-binding protein [Clostridia bacterium]|nr:single-stranded DNA-binding protein [Clostridia bacterium]